MSSTKSSVSDISSIASHTVRSLTSAGCRRVSGGSGRCVGAAGGFDPRRRESGRSLQGVGSARRFEPGGAVLSSQWDWEQLAGGDPSAGAVPVW